MNNQEIVNYVMHTPGNTNPAILKQMLEETSVQSDWNQNDPAAPDYVKNRTHYLKPTTILEYSEFSFSDMGGIYGYVWQHAPDIHERCHVEVTWDDKVYQLTAFNLDGIVCFGNEALYDGEDTGEPFLVMIIGFENMTTICTSDTVASHKVGIVAEMPVKLDPMFLPDTIPFMHNGLIPLYHVLPNASDVFGGALEAGGTYSTLAKPYPNKIILNNLTLESFNAMLDGSMHLPNRVMVGNSIAYVSISAPTMEVHVGWSDYTTYSKEGVGLAGAHVLVYDARIHEDADNPGTIVSEYAIINVADAPLT